MMKNGGQNHPLLMRCAREGQASHDVAHRDVPAVRAVCIAPQPALAALSPPVAC
jgi:hypothetical protein